MRHRWPNMIWLLPTPLPLSLPAPLHPKVPVILKHLQKLKPLHTSMTFSCCFLCPKRPVSLSRGTFHSASNVTSSMKFSWQTFLPALGPQLYSLRNSITALIDFIIFISFNIYLPQLDKQIIEESVFFFLPSSLQSAENRISAQTKQDKNQQQK